MIHSLWVVVVVVCLCTPNCMTEIMWLAQTQSVYLCISCKPGNLNGGFTRILEWDLVDINVPNTLLCPLLWLLRYCVSITYKLESHVLLGTVLLLLFAWLLLPVPAVHEALIYLKWFLALLNWQPLGSLQDGRRKTVKSIRFELDFEKQIFGSLKIYPGHQLTQTGIKYLLGSTWP